jgi:phosphoribosylanthranilate isomerase
MFVKICGITRIEDALAACDLGASALGFVFWPKSPRLVDAERARLIIEALPEHVETVGVFVNQDAREVNDIADRAGLTAVQLHGEETPAYASGIRRRVIKSIALEHGERAAPGWPDEVLWLLDTYDRERRGGTGVMVDWSAAARVAASRKVLLAGGLSPDNVADAIGRVRPYGIDVSSGVEARPGVKDLVRLKALFEAVHDHGNE